MNHAVNLTQHASSKYEYNQYESKGDDDDSEDFRARLLEFRERVNSNQ